MPSIAIEMAAATATAPATDTSDLCVALEARAMSAQNLSIERVDNRQPSGITRIAAPLVDCQDWESPKSLVRT